MALAPIFKKAYWSLAALCAVYFCFLVTLLNGWVQRQALYVHLANTKWWQDPNEPEQFGFLRNQVGPFDIATPDGERLYAWHILPIGLYAKHEGAIVRESSVTFNRHYGSSRAFKLLAHDPNSRLVINFHGNAGTVSQGWRTDCYRNIASADPEHIHILAFDYRGFGHSTGSPTEQGLITDGITCVDFALEVIGIPPERIVILGQSLGTAVSIAVAEHFSVERAIDFKAVILVSPFSDIPTLMLEYAIGGIIPILSPLRPYPRLQRYFSDKIQETWFSGKRLANLVKSSSKLNLHLIHAKNDFEIPWRHSETLFHVAANATSEQGMSSKQINAVKLHRSLGDGGWVDSWKAAQGGGGVKYIEQLIVPHGGHNRVTTYPVVAKAILNAWRAP